ncbi:MAG: hypothetical protein BGO54_20275 [Sphingobacteriales bacterium 46-32]|jgi:mono/diheme cytochrome c family protein|nr:MAG: hypothetical protein BGO54_20275 [Sphingobacteriales bacterium 46-32]
MILCCLALLVLHSCYYDKEQLLYSNSNATCDTAGVASYTQKIVPLLKQYCYSCHTGSFPSGNILMGTYTADKAIALNGKLYGSITHASGYSPMPQGLSKLTDCQIATVKKWIDEGTQNN